MDEFRVASKVIDFGVDYLSLKSETEEGTIAAWTVWNDWLERNGQNPSGLKQRRVAGGFRSACQGMAITWNQTVPPSLSMGGTVSFEQLNMELLQTMKCTRIDHHVTVRLCETDSELPLRLYHYFSGAKSGHVKRMKKRFIDSDTGQTCYLGGRSAARFLRVYDKGGESGTATRGLIYRAEVEHKGGLADKVFSSAVDWEGMNRQSMAEVHGHLRRFGVHLFGARDAIMPVTRFTPRGSDDLSALMWLDRSVVPVLKRLRLNGYGREAAEILGLQEKGG